MRYTFLLPAFKSAYLEKALSSILSQTYTDFKLVVSNDSSPEDIYSIINKYKDDKRLIYRCNEKNLGKDDLVAHWNLLLNLCDTEYFILASDDDVYDINFLKEIDLLIEKYPKVDLFHARAQCIDSNDEVFKMDSLYKEYVSQIGFLEQLDYYNHIECIANYVFRTESLKSKGGFVSFPLAWSSDTATCNIMAQNGVVNTKNVLFSFRMSGINISSQMIENRMVTRLKFKAFCMYDDFMLALLNRIKPADTLLDKTTYSRICNQHKKRMSGLIAWLSVSLPFGEFIVYLKEYKKRGYIDSVFIVIKKWVIARWRW